MFLKQKAVYLFQVLNSLQNTTNVHLLSCLFPFLIQILHLLPIHLYVEGFGPIIYRILEKLKEMVVFLCAFLVFFLVITSKHIGNCKFISILRIGPKEEEDKGKEKRKQTSSIWKHIINLAMSSSSIKNFRRFLDINFYKGFCIFLHCETIDLF